MIDRRLVLVILLCWSCKPAAPPKSGAAAAPAGPQVRATVVTIETKLNDPPRALRHTIAIANGRARSSDELDRWRLFDLKNNRVTFVDDLERTYRTVDFAQLTADRQRALADDDVPSGLPRAEVLRPSANELVVRMGAYERRLRFAQHDAIPPQLFAMMQASEPIATPLAPIMHAAEEALLGVKGFPVEDHAELPFGNRKMVVDRKVVSVAQTDVPGTMFDVNRAYREIPIPAATTAPKPKPRGPRAVVQETTTIAEPPKVEPVKPKPVVKKAAPKKPAVKKAAPKKPPPKKAAPKKKVTPKKKPR